MSQTSQCSHLNGTLWVRQGDLVHTRVLPDHASKVKESDWKKLKGANITIKKKLASITATGDARPSSCIIAGAIVQPERLHYLGWDLLCCPLQLLQTMLTG